MAVACLQQAVKWGVELSVTGGRVRVGLFAGATVLLCVNAMALWGTEVAWYVDAALQVGTGIGVMLCGLVVARRVSGKARLWRLLVVAAVASWLLGQGVWWSKETVMGTDTAPVLSVVAYFLPPLFGAAASMVILSAGGGVTGRQESHLRPSRVITVLDGLVAAISFSILVFIAGFGQPTGAALPRSDSPAVVSLYSVIELVVVVVSVQIAMVYRSDRPYRANFLLLVGGVVLIASSDRTVAYLVSVGATGGELWGGIGFLLGPLLIGYALLQLPPRPAKDLDRGLMTAVQLALPYVGFLGNAVLFAYHLLAGHRLSPVLILSSTLMVMLVVTRQVIAMRAQRLLTQRLYETQGRLAHQVHHDSLTGLPNRLLFAQRLDAAILDGPFVLIFVDLDDFKDVNDRFGHAAGDELLCSVGQRLQRCVGPADTLARIGGDEFAILINGEDEPPEVVADRIRVALRDPFALHSTSVRVRASMGLVRPGADELPPTSDDLLRQADVSMYAGKRVGKNTAVIFRPSLGVTTDFPTALRKAGGEIPPGFSLAYQPVVRLPEGTPVAVEALARWIAPNGTQIQPEAFVAAAEAAGLGAKFDAMVLDLACSEVEAAGLDLVLHVNIGAARLGSHDFEREVQATLARHGMAPSQLVIEITESVPIVDVADAAAQITRLNALGIKVALDDFGAGYNSLTYLHALPVQIIKLDRSLAVGAQPDRTETLYRSVIGLCDALDLDVIAEGIESTTQADTVFAAGCPMAQGHLFGRAVPIAELSLSSSASP